MVPLWPVVDVPEAQVVPSLTHPTAPGNQFRYNLPVTHPQHTGLEILNRMLLLNCISKISILLCSVLALLGKPLSLGEKDSHLL